MKKIKRKAAVFGFSMLFTLIAYMAVGIRTAYFLIPAAIVITAAAVIKRSSLTHLIALIGTAVLCAFLILLFYNEVYYRPSLELTGENRTVTGTVCEYPSDSGSSFVTLKNCTVDNTKTKSRIKLWFSDEYQLKPGDKLRFQSTKLYVSADETNKYFFHSLSDRNWLNCTAFDELTVEPAGKRTVTELIASLRSSVKKKILLSAFPGERTSVICALLTGDQSYIPQKYKNDFRRAGISHILAVSGMHLSIWSGVLFLIFQRRTRTRKWGNIAAIVFIVLYCFFTGLSPSVLRASVMLITVYAAAFFNKHADALNSLGLSAIFLLFYDPWLAGNISFLLSFFATFGIVAVSPVFFLRKKEDEKRIVSFFRKYGNAVIVSFCVIFAILPFTAFFFGYISVLSPISALLCTPPAEGIMVLTGLAMIFPSGSFLFRLFFSAADLLTAVMLRLSVFFSEVPWGVFSLREGYITGWFILTCISLFLVYVLTRGKFRPMAITALICTAAIICTGFASHLNGRNDVNLYVPAGEGRLSAALTFNNGKYAVLIGTGGGYSAKSGISSFMMTNEVDDIDLVIIPDVPDKTEDILPDIKDYFSFGEIVMEEEAGKIHAADGVTYKDSVTLTPGDGITFSYETFKNGWAGILTVQDKKIVFLDTDAETSETLSEEYRSGDTVICKQSDLPGIDTSLFGQTVTTGNINDNIDDNVFDLTEKDYICTFRRE